MKPTNVVIDTNVLATAIRSKNGASYRLLMELPNGSYMPNISVPLFVEYEDVLKRESVNTELSNQDIDAILDYFLSKAEIREIFYLWRPFLKAPKDDMVLELAVESNSNYIVTYNKRDYKDIHKFGIQALTPLEFLQLRGII